MTPNPSNPYLADEERPVAPFEGTYAPAAGPDLQDTTPSLRQAESQRVNRKALLFLAGIVALLVLMAAWMFARATGKDADKAIRSNGEVVRIPELPQAATMPAAAAEPIPLAADPTYAAAPAELPPLPAPEPMAASYGPPPSAYPPMAPPPPPPPSLMERRMGAITEAGPQSPQDLYTQAMLASLQGGQAKAAAAEPTGRPQAGARYILNPDALLVRGTYIRCVLETRIVTEVEGFTSCVVTEPVYSINGRSLLLPKGSKVLGRYKDEPKGPRVAVVWDRITTPNGIDMNMASPGVDGLGSAGHPGHYDAHWASRITSALLVSLIADGFEYAAAKNGPRSTYTNGDLILESPFESKTARTLESVAQQAVASGGRRPPVVTINQGTVVNVYVAKDIDFSSVVARR